MPVDVISCTSSLKTLHFVLSLGLCLNLDIKSSQTQGIVKQMNYFFCYLSVHCSVFQNLLRIKLDFPRIKQCNVTSVCATYLNLTCTISSEGTDFTTFLNLANRLSSLLLLWSLPGNRTYHKTCFIHIDWAWLRHRVQLPYNSQAFLFRVPTFSDWQNSMIFPWFFQVF